MRKMDIDKIQKRIENIIFGINKRNKSFDMICSGSLRNNALVVVAISKRPKSVLICPKCHKSDNITKDTEHFAKCYNCNRRFILPNQPKCSRHSSMKPCRYCKAEKERKLHVH